MAICTVNLTVVDQSGNPVSGIQVKYYPKGNPTPNVQLIDPVTVYSSGTSSPNLILQLEQGMIYNISSGTGSSGLFPIPMQSSWTPTQAITSQGVANQTPPTPNTMAALAANTPVGNIVITAAGGQVGDSGVVALPVVAGAPTPRFGFVGGAVVYTSGSTNLASNNTPTPWLFTNTLFDTFNASSIVTVNSVTYSQITIPSGIFWARIWGKAPAPNNPVITTNPTSFFGQLQVGGIQPIPHAGDSSFLTDDPLWVGVQAAGVKPNTGMIPVTPGNVWTFAIGQNGGVSIPITASSFGAEFYA